MSVRRVSPRLRPRASGLTMALVLAGCLSSLGVVAGVATQAAADTTPSSTTSTTDAPPTTTTTPTPPITTPPSRTTTTQAPSTTTTANVPPTTAVPPTSIPVPTTAVAPTSTTSPQSQTGSSGPVALAVVVSTGDGLVVRGTDGTESPAQVGQSLQQGDQLSTTGAPGSSAAARPATIRWLQGGMTDIYDAMPRIFVRGHKSVPAVATTISIDADPTPTLRVDQGFARFWFPPAEKGWYSFVASTESVVATVKGTDFTIGDDPATKTSTVGVTQDTVEVAPVNSSLQPFQLSAGSQVQVTADRVGPITPLADQSANSSRTGPRSTTTTLALWLVGLLLTVAVVSGAVGLASLWRDRRHSRPGRPVGGLSRPGRPVAGLSRPGRPADGLSRPERLARVLSRPRRRRGRHAPPAPVLPPRPVTASDLSFAHAGSPGHTEWVTLPSGASGEDTEPVPATAESAGSAEEKSRRADEPSAWQPTHRVPPEGMKARAIPVADAGDVARLDPDLAVRMVEHRGDWANVLAADGWSGWVDASQLRPEPDAG